MDKKIEIKEEDLLTDDITSQNETEFFHKIVSMKTSTDAVLLETDCDMTVKTEIKSETPFIKHLVEQIETEPAPSSNNWVLNRENEVEQQTLFSDVGSQNEGEFHLEDPVIIDTKYNSDHEIHNKIEIKEEPWWLETEALSVCDKIKVGDFHSVKSSRLQPETFDGAICSKSPPFLSAEIPAEITSFCAGIDCLEYEYQKCDVTDDVLMIHTDHYGKCSDDAHTCIEPIHVKQRSVSPMSKGPSRCNICEKSFSCVSHLKAHILNHKGKKLHECKTCKRSFTRLHTLKLHINSIHEGKKPHQCKVCNKKFAYFSHLNAHNLIHEGKKVHQCKVCDKKFTLSSHLKRHYLIHEGKREHQCKVCEKTFTQSSTLRRHNLLHEGKRPHQCKVCDKSFTRSSDLKAHNFIHEGKKPHQCKVCDKSFTQLSNLRRHNFVHGGKKPHQCKVCDKSFSQLSLLKTHNLVHEGKNYSNVKIVMRTFSLVNFEHT